MCDIEIPLAIQRLPVDSEWGAVRGTPAVAMTAGAQSVPRGILLDDSDED
jgi:hypothetical protein